MTTSSTQTSNDLQKLVTIPAHEAIIGASDDELEMIRDYYREAYGEKYDVTVHQIREQPRHSAQVSAFALAATPVTNREFVEFCEDTEFHNIETLFITENEKRASRSVWRTPVGETKREQFFALKDADDESWLDHPLTCINWHEAMLFCYWKSACEGLIDPNASETKWEAFVASYESTEAPEPDSPPNTPGDRHHLGWLGYRLPTSAEWEAASRYRPDTELLSDPSVWWWGNDIYNGDGRCNSSDYTSQRRFTKWITCPWEGTHEYTSPVGSFPANPAGLSDMAGNIWEWCLDTFHPAFYQRCTDAPLNDPLCLWDPKQVDRNGNVINAPRIARGGGWHNLPANIRQASRRVHETDRARCNLGLRIARSILP
jgi:formylglycine-generating enzyme required for sulfatase activity